MKEIKIKGLVRPSYPYLRPKTNDEFSRKILRDLYFSLRDQGTTEEEVEIIIRVPEPRKDWVNKWYDRAMTAARNWDIFIKHCKQSTFICTYACGGHSEMASAAPRHGDKYDYKTGIAVAYAKLKNEPIPDYI